MFISYVREDSDAVDDIADAFESAGVTYWRDTDDLPPGVHWKRAIRRAIEDGFVFLACFSSASEARDRSYMREELSIAIEEIRLRPEDRTWFIPAMLDPCNVPDIRIRPGFRLSDIQGSRLYGGPREMARLVETVRTVVEA